MPNESMSPSTARCLSAPKAPATPAQLGEREKSGAASRRTNMSPLRMRVAARKSSGSARKPWSSHARGMVAGSRLTDVSRDGAFSRIPGERPGCRAYMKYDLMSASACAEQDPHPGRAALEPDGEAVQAGDRLDQRQAEAAAGGRAAAV